MEQIEVLGLCFHQTSLEKAVGCGRGWLNEEGFHMVVTPNPEFILMAQKNEVFRQTLRGADLVLPDGIGVIYASKILGRSLKGRVPGIDFATGLLGELNQTGGRLFLLGAKEGVAQQAGENIARDYPNLVICGSHHGYFKEDQDEAVCDLIVQAKPDVIFVCFGAPRQEIFLKNWGGKTGAKIGIGLGGALDVYAGTVERAPASWQKCNCEWLYRLVKEPKRFGRMAKLPLVLFQAVGARITGGKKYLP